ncbi:hypothetical protein ACFQVC_32525 [Streptomyces monticola]|uniref:Transposase n=1 Tax=Streptomyces monticola TaxID=2666263 RepID=A0ABW2JST3_9ACTN
MSRAGDRQLNSALHVMAITQIRHKTAGQAYYLRKRPEGKGVFLTAVHADTAL